MSKASHGAPAKRKDSADEIADVNTPVKVDREDGDTLLGIVRERHNYHEYDAPARVVVEGKDQEVNVSAENVTVAKGTNADLVRNIIRKDTNV